MRLGMLVAILGDLPVPRSRDYAPREKDPRREAPPAGNPQPAVSRAKRTITRNG